MPQYWRTNPKKEKASLWLTPRKDVEQLNRILGRGATDYAAGPKKRGAGASSSFSLISIIFWLYKCLWHIQVSPFIVILISFQSSYGPSFKLPMRSEAPKRCYCRCSLVLFNICTLPGFPKACSNKKSLPDGQDDNVLGLHLLT